MANRVTIDDIARRAGVSKSTVSHALSGRRPISNKVRQRILDVVDRVGYRPSSTARSLAMRKTMVIGVLTPGIQNPYSAAFVETLERAMKERNYKMLLGISSDRQEALAYLRDFRSGMVDWVMNMVSSLSSLDARLACRDIPVVTYQRPEPESPVYLDFISGVLQGMEHLWSLGHRRIGFIATNTAAPEELEEQRLLGYRQYLDRQQVEVDPELIMEGGGRMEDGFELGARLHRRGATAIFASNDLMAMGVLHWARESEVNVPRDLSVIGFDDIPQAVYAVPPLTTVQIPLRVLSSVMVRELVNRIEGQTHMQQEVVVPKLIIRKSTGPAARQPAENGGNHA